MIGRIAALIAPIVKAAKLAAWPVGSIYMSLQATSPATLFGGTWERVAGRMLIGADDDNFPSGDTGGQESHRHWLPIIGNTSNGNITKIHWNYDFDYEVRERTSPNVNELTTAPRALELAGWQYSSSSESVLPPYIAVYMWRRTA